MRRIITFTIFLCVFIASATFAAFNMTPVTVNFYLAHTTLPLSVIIVIAMLAGVIIGALALFLATLKLRYENRRLHHKLSLSEQEINSLRILPIKDAH